MTAEIPYVSKLRLERSSSARPLIDELAHDLPRVGLDGVLARLNREAEPCTVPALAAAPGFVWDADDRRTIWWYPQGITTSADATDTGDLDGRRVIITSWYAKTWWGRRNKGVRLSVVDYTDPSRPRYRHVLLVEPFRDEATGEVDLRPVTVHAGGLCWYGDYLYVAATGEGIKVFEIDDLIAVPGSRDDLIGRQSDGRYCAFDYRFVLPQSFSYDAWTAECFEQLRYSFLSLDRTGQTHHLVAGEYGTDGATTRLTRYALDRETYLLSPREDGHAWPLELLTDQVDRMQGAALAHGHYVITSSQGRATPGDLWTGRPGALTRHPGVLAIGPEDITYWPSRQQLWTLTEWPARRWVYAIDARRFIPDLP